MLNHTHTDSSGEGPPGQPVGPRDVPNRRWSDGLAGNNSSDPVAPWSMERQWPTLVSTLSEQCVDTTNLVLNAIDFLAGTGRLRPVEVRTLSAILYALRDTSLRAQQITRLSSGRAYHNSDRLELATVVRDLVNERHDEFTKKRAEVTFELQPVDVLLASPVAVTLINTVIDWALSFSLQVHFVLDTPTWPDPARLIVQVVTKGAGGKPDAGTSGGKLRGRRVNDGLHWMLLRQMVASANLKVLRSGGNGLAELVLEFPKTFNSFEGGSSLELYDVNDTNAFTLFDAWVLVIVKDPSLRAAALQCLKVAGISAKAAADIGDARRAVTGAQPDAIVVCTDSMTEHFVAYRSEILNESHRCPVVEITEQRPSFNFSGFDSVERVRIGQTEVRKELAPAVLFELVKGL